jgi:hypothetical protein
LRERERERENRIQISERTVKNFNKHGIKIKSKSQI